MAETGEHYFRRLNNTKIWWLSASGLTAPASPTAAEFAASATALDLSPEIAAISGLRFVASLIGVPTLNDNFDGQIAGVDKVEDTTLTMYELKPTSAGDTNLQTRVNTRMRKGENGYLGVFRHGYFDNDALTPSAGDDVDIWSVQSTGSSPSINLNEEAAQFEISLAALARPNQNTKVY